MSGKGSGRLSIAGLLAYRPGHRPHLYYRQVTHRGRKNERRSLSEADYAALLRAAHHQLHAPIILIWDNLNTHVSKRMNKFVAAHTDWLTVVRLPAYAPSSTPPRVSGRTSSAVWATAPPPASTSSPPW